MIAMLEELPPCLRKCESCVVREQAICRGLEIHELTAVDPFSHTRHCQAGEVLIYQGDHVNFFGTVKRGIVTRWQSMADGRSQLLAVIFPGGHIGSVEASQSNCELRCSSPVELCIISGPKIRQLLQNYPKLEHHLRQLREQELEETRLHLTRLGVMSAREKIISFLDQVRRVNIGIIESEELKILTSSSHRRPANPDTMRIELPLYMKRGDIAQYLGLTIETVSRKLTELHRDGVIDEIKGKQVRLRASEFKAALAAQTELVA